MGSKGGDVQISRLGTVRIDLLKSGEDILNIAESTENDGTFVWNIPEDLEADNDYKIKISSAESSEVSYTSSRFELRGASEVPKAPANLRFDPYQPTSPGSLTYFVTLRWADKSDNETGFKVQRQDTVNTNWKNVANLAANTKTYTDTGLKGDRQYTYRVVAYNDDGNSGYSNEVDVPILDYPTNVQALSLAGPKVGLSWTDNSSLETAYVIERKVDSGGWAVIGSTSANDTYFEDSSVSVGPTYSYRIRAVTDVSGETVYSAYSSTVSIKFN